HVVAQTQGVAVQRVDALRRTCTRYEIVGLGLVVRPQIQATFHFPVAGLPARPLPIDHEEDGLVQPRGLAATFYRDDGPNSLKPVQIHLGSVVFVPRAEERDGESLGKRTGNGFQSERHGLGIPLERGRLADGWFVAILLTLRLLPCRRAMRE